MAHFSGVDGRSPGDQWVRTESGWHRLLDPQASGGGGAAPRPPLEASARPDQAKKEPPPVDLRAALDHKCVSARPHSRESTGYATVSDAVKKLNFLQALHDHNCLPIVCEVCSLLIKERYWNLSGSSQGLLLKICATAQEIALSSKKDISLVSNMLENAITALETGKTLEMSDFIKRKIDSKIEDIVRLKEKLEVKESFQPRLHSEDALDCLRLSDDCLRHVVRYLSEPKDVLKLGLANKRLYRLTHENWVWRELTHYHYHARVDEALSRVLEEYMCGDEHESGAQATIWYQVFRREYELSRCHLRMESALCLCKFCHFVYWKRYGHPCCTYASSNDQTADQRSGRHEDITYLTAESFLALFTT